MARRGHTGEETACSNGDPLSRCVPAMDPAHGSGGENGARSASGVGLRPALPPHLVAPVWMVWVEDADPVGPVSADQIARGLRAGKVPSDARIKRDADMFWTDLLDQEDVVAALKAVSEETEPPPPPSVVERLSTAEYLVWLDGGDPVGPVSADQIARGIRAGKVPADANVQRVGDLCSAAALDEPEIILALKQL